MVEPRLAHALRRWYAGDLAVRRNPIYYPAISRALGEVQEMDLEQRESWTRSALVAVLARASRTRYGQEVGGGLEIARWPLLSKDQVRDRPGLFHAAGPRLSVGAATGGTTGLPLELTRSLRSVVAEQVFLDALQAQLDVDPATARTAVLRGDDVKSVDDCDPPFWRFSRRGRRVTLSSNHLTRSSVRHYVDVLGAFRPHLLWAYPSALESLCHLVESAGLELTVDRVLCSSEVLRPRVRRLAERVLGCRVLDHYGQAERVALAYSHADGFRFFAGYSFVELVPHSVDTWGQLWEIVGTGLWNDTMPLVRYRTGDLVRLPPRWGAAERREVSLGVRRFPGIEGRDSDVLFAPSPPRVLTGVDHIQRGVPHVLRLQVVQAELDRVELLVAPAAGYSPADAARLEANARRKIPSSVRVEIVTTQAFHRTAQGKTPFVVRSPEVDRALVEARRS